jgi:hypothetical protein
MPFHRTPLLVFRRERPYPGEKFGHRGPMLRRNPLEAIMPMNRDSERAGYDRHHRTPSEIVA